MRAPWHALLAAALLAAACCRGGDPAPAAATGDRPAGEAQAPRGLVAMRPRFRYSGGLEFVGGVGFMVRGARGWALAVTSAHLVASRAEWRDGKVAVDAVEFLDARSRRPLAAAAAVAHYGSRASGIELARDVAVFVLGAPPDGVAVLEVASRPPELREEVTVYACSQEGAGSQVALQGVVVHRDAGRVEVELAPGANTRAIAGAPVVSRRDGTVVAVAQSSASRGDAPLLLCGPASGLREALDGLPERPAKVAGWTAGG